MLRPHAVPRLPADHVGLVDGTTALGAGDRQFEIDSSSVNLQFLLANAGRVNARPVAMARKHARPFEYLGANLRREDAARKVAERDGITDGLVCVISTFVSCRTFSLRFTTGQPYVQSAERKCLPLHFSFMDHDLGSSTFAGRPGSHYRSSSTSTAMSGALAN